MSIITFLKNQSKKTLLIFSIITLIVVSTILTALILIIFNQSKDSATKESNQLELADDSTEAFIRATQPYNLEDGTPTFDLYGEIGYIENESDAPSVMLRSDYNPDAQPCDQTDYLDYEDDPEIRDKCLGLSKEKLAIPNHATLQTYNGSYKLYHNEDKSDWSWVDEYAYAFLPDGSMVNMSNAKIQFNFYDNETRIVQMSGRAYYRVKKQDENHKFTIQVGDRIIELSDAETQIIIGEDSTAMDKNLDELNDLYVDQKNGQEIDEEKINELKSQSYYVNVIHFAGTGNMYNRGETLANASILDDGDNSYKHFTFKDYKDRVTTDADQEEYERLRESTLSSYYYTSPAMFSIDNYGLGNFNSVSVEDLYAMLMVYFDNASINDYASTMKYRQDMDDFTTEWNNLMKEIGKCNEGWYKTSTGTCCPEGTIHNPTKGTCTKTTYYYYCDEGWTLGSDNMCHRQGSSGTTSQETKTPTYNPDKGSRTDQCYDRSKLATFQLCKMGVSTGSSHMEGSKCCFDWDVPDPQLEPVK